jgi:iron complex transport system permease protein
VSDLLDFGRRTFVLRVGPLSWRTHHRTVLVGLATVVVLVLTGLVALGLGSFQVSVPDVARALVGLGPEQIQTLIWDWRLSRVVLAALIGVALGVSGAIFQSLTRNPLGSPDVIGFTAGAYSGSLLAMTIVGLSYQAMIVGGLVGGIVTALVIYLLAYKRGVGGFRLIVVGIGVTAMLGSLNSYLILRAEQWQAVMASVWGAGSINGLDWSDVRLVGGMLVVVLPLTLGLAGRMGTLELGDDAAAGLGIRVERVRVLLVVLGVALVAIPSTVAGPITFVALAAPHIARRVTRGSGVLLVPSAVVGATLMVVCDLIALHAFDPVILPVGLVTVMGGGAYLAWLLARQARREMA